MRKGVDSLVYLLGEEPKVINYWTSLQTAWPLLYPALKKGNDTGYAFLASRGDVVICEGGGAFGNTSVFQAEVVAIQAALLWLISNPHKLKGTKVMQWSDSQSALQSIFSLKSTSKLVEDTI